MSAEAASSTVSPSSFKQARAAIIAQRVRLKVHCGCGATYDVLDDGVFHCAETGHTLHITGEIRAER